MGTSEEPDKTTVNIRMTEDFLESVDDTWRAAGFDSRSEFVRAVLRDAVKHPEFNRADLKAMLASEVEYARGEVHPSRQVTAEFELGEDEHDADTRE